MEEHYISEETKYINKSKDLDSKKSITGKKVTMPAEKAAALELAGEAFTRVSLRETDLRQKEKALDQKQKEMDQLGDKINGTGKDQEIEHLQKAVDSRDEYLKSIKNREGKSAYDLYRNSNNFIPKEQQTYKEANYNTLNHNNIER